MITADGLRAAPGAASGVDGPCGGADEALCRWALGDGAPAATDPTRLAGIYARDGFEEAASRGAGGWERLLAELGDFFESLFASTGAQGFAEWTRFLILAIAVGLAALLLYRVGGRILERIGAGHRPLPRAPSSGLSTAVAAANASRMHLGRARELVERIPREGIREGLLGLLAALESAGLSRPDRVRTNRELARELPARGAPDALVGEVRALLDWYDRAFYSLARVEVDEAQRFLGSVESVISDHLQGARA